MSNFNCSFSRTVGTELFLSHQHGLNHSLFGELPKLEYRTNNLYVPDHEDKSFLNKEFKIRELFYFPKQNNLESQRDEIVNKHLGIDSNISLSKIKRIFIVDFIILTPYFLFIYCKYFFKFLKNKLIF